MRYENKATGEWLEIEGARRMPMSALHDLYAALEVSAPIMLRVVKAHNLQDWDGEPVELGRTVTEQTTAPGPDGKPVLVERQRPYANVTTAQLAFIRKSIVSAISDEELDPEA